MTTDQPTVTTLLGFGLLIAGLIFATYWACFRRTDRRVHVDPIEAELYAGFVVAIDPESGMVIIANSTVGAVRAEMRHRYLGRKYHWTTLPGVRNEALAKSLANSSWIDEGA